MRKKYGRNTMFEKYAPLVFVILFALFVGWMIWGMENAVPQVGL